MATLNLQIQASTDDARELVATEAMFLNQVQGWFGDVVADASHDGFRFIGVSGLSGATINTAVLTFRAGASDIGNFEGDWFAHDVEVPGTFTAVAGNISDVAQRPRTTATCEGDGTDFGNWTAGQDHQFTGDGANYIKDIIQELADSYDPSAIALLWIYTSGTGERIWRSWDHATDPAPKLDIDYDAAIGADEMMAAIGGGGGGGGGGSGDIMAHSRKPPEAIAY